MSAYIDEWNTPQRWRYRVQIRLPDGSHRRIQGTPAKNTKEAAERAEREHINRLEEQIRNPKPKGEPKREPPKFEAFAKTFLEISETRNKPSSIEAKESILRVHLTPIFGRKPIDQIGFTEIQDYITSKTKAGLSKKTINNHLTVLRRLLVVAKKRALIEVVPEIEWLRVPEQDFDYLDFGEAQRLIDGADEEWRPMITLAIKTGLRLGELLALRWREDVDLVKGQIVVRQSVTRGIVTTPKSGKKREVDLGDEAIAALKSARHLRGPLVFCSADGRMMGKNEVKHPLWRACRKAGLRQIGWHVLRHTFASHLAMRGAPLKAIQELLGHATIEMTMRYSHLSPAVRRDVVRMLDSLPRSASG
ncbi:MAG TPA: site-specific integrase [Polyangia bacterium]|nr:site-specific integrase [Polyangia bacterium]